MGNVIATNVMMGPDVIILSRNHEFADLEKPLIEQGHSEIKKVVIEDNVWIGTRVIIMPGVTIGTGSIVGEGSIVNKDIPANKIVGENKAKVIRNRSSKKDLSGGNQ